MNPIVVLGDEPHPQYSRPALSKQFLAAPAWTGSTAAINHPIPLRQLRRGLDNRTEESSHV